MLQKEPEAGKEDVPVIILTHRVREASVNAAITAIEKLDAITSPLCRIRVEALEG